MHTTYLFSGHYVLKCFESFDVSEVEEMMTETSQLTIATIADTAGVSVSTVSKVLNGRPDVARATRERVEKIIDSHGYQRRGRRQAATRLIDVVFHELGSPWSIEIIRGVEDVASVARAGVVLSEAGGDRRPHQEWLDDVLQRRPLGVLLVLSQLTASQRRQLETRSIPIVVVDTLGEPPAGLPTVGSQNWNGGLAATRHLVELGHRNVAVISGEKDMLCSRARVDGYRTALAEVGVNPDPSLIRYGNFFVDAGYENARDLLTRPDRPTAIFAGSDMHALGVLRAARELGLNVPRDLSVVGYDDLPVIEWTDPPLTTVRQPLREMAAMATEMVLSMAKGESPTNLRIDLATELVVRASTAPPAEAE